MAVVFTESPVAAVTHNPKKEKRNRKAEHIMTYSAPVEATNDLGEPKASKKAEKLVGLSPPPRLIADSAPRPK